MGLSPTRKRSFRGRKNQKAPKGLRLGLDAGPEDDAEHESAGSPDPPASHLCVDAQARHGEADEEQEKEDD